MFQAAMQQRIGHRRPQPFEALLRQRIDVAQRQEAEGHGEPFGGAGRENQRLGGVDDRKQRQRGQNAGGHVEHRHARLLCMAFPFGSGIALRRSRGQFIHAAPTFVTSTKLHSRPEG
ncbi:hypothetical protein D3C72_1912190 [compost metagenome]